MRAAAPRSIAGSSFQWKKKHTIIAACAAVALLAVILSTVLVVKSRGEPPPMNATIEQMANFVASSGYNQLPFDRQRQYMERLDERKSELADAFKNRKISSETAQVSVNHAWLGKRLHEMELFYSATEGEARDEYLTALARKLADKKKPKNPAIPPAAGTPEEPDEDGLPSHDPVSEREIPNNWPPDVQQQWTIFRSDLAAKVKEIQKEKKRASGQTSGKKKNSGGGSKTGKKTKAATTRPAATVTPP